MKRYHDDENDLTCDQLHRELFCEDCDVRRMSQLTLDDVEDLHLQGRITQDDFEAYAWLHARFSPYSGVASVPEIPAVLRIARKLLATRPELPALPELNNHELAA